MITHLYNFESDREIEQVFQTPKIDIYNVPVAIFNDDIRLSYQVRARYQGLFRGYVPEYSVYLADNRNYLDAAIYLNAVIDNDPYNNAAKIAYFDANHERDAYTLTRYIAIQESIKYAK